MSEAPVRRPATVLLVIAVSAFLATFNETFLNVALTPIMQDFSISSAMVQWGFYRLHACSSGYSTCHKFFISKYPH